MIEYEKLIKQYGTPLYIFDESELMRRITYLQSRLPDDTGLCYAVKANTFICESAAQLVQRLEVCSEGEAEICLKLGILPEKLVISGVYKNPQFIEKMFSDFSAKGIYTIESTEQARMLVGLAEKYSLKPNVLIRITGGNQFGLDRGEALRIAAECCGKLNINGIQFYSGTQKTSLKKIRRELEMLDGFIEKLRDESRIDACELEYGAGFPVNYFTDSEFDENAYLAEFSELFGGMRFGGKKFIELGRSIAASCGSYVTKIVDIKRTGGQTYAITDGGINHIAYYGQSLAMRIPELKIFPERDGEPESVNVCGALCTVNDILVKQLPVKNPQIGDAIAFLNAGAYCATEGISLFLSRCLPLVLMLCTDGKIRILRNFTETSAINAPQKRKD